MVRHSFGQVADGSPSDLLSGCRDCTWPATRPPLGALVSFGHRHSSFGLVPIPLTVDMAWPAWQGHLRLSLVSCAVSLYRATTTISDISFNLINPATGNRIKMIATDPDMGPVERWE